ncbi:MAG TPA: hypothetical protein PLZ95_04875 [Bryobacteraceae bacterium]|nr:hypothetical protein [Bryobacteraceae bacterium]
MITRRPPKGFYSEMEVAATIGVSVEQLRSLVRSHIVQAEEDADKIPKAWYQPSDIVLLRMLVSGMAGASSR